MKGSYAFGLFPTCMRGPSGADLLTCKPQNKVASPPYHNMTVFQMVCPTFDLMLCGGSDSSVSDHRRWCRARTFAYVHWRPYHHYTWGVLNLRPPLTLTTRYVWACCILQPSYPNLNHRLPCFISDTTALNARAAALLAWPLEPRVTRNVIQNNSGQYSLGCGGEESLLYADSRKKKFGCAAEMKRRGVL